MLLSALESQERDSAEEEISDILSKLRKKSKYGVYLDITPPEVHNKGWKVVRTFFPELVQMCLPSFPYSNHPRMQEFGGIKMAYPIQSLKTAMVLAMLCLPIGLGVNVSYFLSGAIKRKK